MFRAILEAGLHTFAGRGSRLGHGHLMTQLIGRQDFVLNANAGVESRPLFHRNVVPECHITFDVGGCRRGLGVAPRCVFVSLSVRDDRIVFRRTLPWAAARRPARLEELPMDRVWREIVVALYDDGFVRFSNRRSVPSRRRHLLSPLDSRHISQGASNRSARKARARAELLDRADWRRSAVAC
jgi:hypothetical protein